MNPPWPAPRWLRLLPHILVTIAFLLIVASLTLRSWQSADARVHVVGCTFIFHQTGELVVRLPSDRLVRSGILTSFDSDAMTSACLACMGAWLVWIVAAPVIASRRRRPQPRGFPLD